MKHESPRRSAAFLFQLVRVILFGILVASAFAFPVTPVRALSFYAEINQEFSPLSVVAGEVSRLEITIFNPNDFQLDNASFTNSLVGVQPGLRLANFVDLTNTCGGIAIAVAGSTTIQLSGGTVPPQVGSTPGECTVAVYVTSTTPGNLINTIPAYDAPGYGGVGLHSTARGGLDTIVNSSPSSATIQIINVQAPSMNKNFSPNTVWVGQSTQLEINVYNNDLIHSLTEATFTDNLPATFKIASPLTASLSGCGAGTISAVVGGSSVTLNNATIAPNSNCRVRIRVVSRIQGQYTNTIPAGPAGVGALATRQGVTNGTPVTGFINVQAVGLEKVFSPETITEDEPSTLTITLNNPTGADYTNVGLVDTLPAGVVVYGIPDPTQCDGAISYTATSITLTGGTIPAGSILSPGACTIVAEVTSSTPGHYINTLPAGRLTGPITNAFDAIAELEVLPRTITVVKSFSSGYFFTGSTAPLTIVLENRTATAFTNVAFTDTMPVGLLISGIPYASASCGSSALVTSSSNSITLSHGVVPPGTALVPGTCTIRANVTSLTPGAYTNTIPAHDVTSAEGIGNDSDSNAANITVYLATPYPVTVSKRFFSSSVLAGNPVGMRITIQAPIDTALSGIAISDTLPDGMLIAGSPSPAPATTCGGSLTAAVGTRLISLTGGSISTRGDPVNPNIGTCTITVYAVANDAATYTNTIPGGTLASFEGRTDPFTRSASVTVTNLVMSKQLTPSTITPNGFSRLTIFLRNTNLVPLVNVSLTDSLTSMGGDASNGVFVADPADISSTCGPNVNADPGFQTITLSNGVIPASDGVVPGLCTISVNVQGIGALTTRTNTIPRTNVVGTIQGTSTTINAVNDATASLTITPLSIQVVKGFDPVLVYGGTSSTMTILLVNPGSVALTGIKFTDTMPTNMILSNPVDFNVGTCGGTLTGTPGTSTFSFSGGTLPPGGSCELTLRATMTVIGNLTNTIPAGAVSSFEGARNPQPTSASLTNLPGATISKAFAPNPVAAGDYSLLTITINNTGSVALTGMGMNDGLPGVLPAGLAIANWPVDAPAPTNTCGGSLSAVPDSQDIILTGGALAGGGACTIVVPVTSTVPNDYLNTIEEGNLTNDQGRTNVAKAEDTLVVTAFSLGNRVWNDLNDNGLQDSGEPGLNGLTVNLYLDADENGVPDAGVLATTTTATDGYYRFDALGAGTYLVEVIPPSGYISSTVDGGDADTNPLDTDDNGITVSTLGVMSAPVTLGPGAIEPVSETNPVPNPETGEAPDNQSNRTVDFGFFEAYSLGNRVWFDNGVGTGGILNDGVRNGDEPGIQDVRVNLYRDADNNGIPDGALIAFTQTDADGYYRFDKLLPGTYIVEVITPLGYTNTYKSGGDPDTNPADNDNNGMVEVGSLVRSNPVTLGPVATTPEPVGETDSPTGATPGIGESPDDQSNRTVDFGFVTGYSLGNRVWFDNGAGGGTANDGLLNGSEPGINGVTVNLYDDSNDDGTPDGSAISTHVTAGGGYYRFDGLLSGTYIVEIVPPAGYVNAPVTGGDPDVDVDDNDNNGAVTAGSNLRSYPVTLGPDGGEPEFETDPTANPELAEAADNYSNRTVDFGLYYEPYSLGNRVWADNGAGTGGVANDGLRNGSEPGLGSVTVYLYRDSDDNGSPDGSAIAITTTDADGYYRFDYLQADTYIVEVVTPAGYTSSTVDAGDADTNPNDDDDNGVVPFGNNIRSNPVTLGPSGGEPEGELDSGPALQPGEAPDAYSNLTVDFGFIPVAAIGDRVWYDLDQDGIQDLSESGVTGVTVTLYTGAGSLVSSTVTTGGGNYNFTDLVPGDYYVVFTAPTDYIITLQDQGADDTLDSDANPTAPNQGRTATTTLTAGENDLSWDAGMYLPTTMIGDLVWNDTNRDGVQDVGETGIPNVAVYLYRPGYGPDGIPDSMDDDQPVDDTLTNGSGNYFFIDLYPGDYYLVFVPPVGYAISPIDQGNDAADSDVSPTTLRTVTTTLSPGESDLTWDAGMYNAPASLGDLVWLDDNGNGIQDGGAETGVNGVTVHLYRPGFGPDRLPGNGDDAAIVATDITAGGGLYEFTGLTPGDYYVSFIRPTGYVISPRDRGADDALDSDANPSNGRTILTSLAPDENDLTWDMGISQPASLGDYVWNDLDRDGVQDVTETGINGITVDLYNSSDILVATTTTANVASVDGIYHFSNLVPGVYYLAFTPPAAYAISPIDQGGDNALDSDVNPSTNRTVDITLTSGQNDLTWDAGVYELASLGNYVWNDLNQNGLQDDGASTGVDGVTVDLYSGGGSFVSSTVTAGGGLYNFGDLIPGNYYVVFTPPAGYTITLQDVGTDNEIDSDANRIAPDLGRTATTLLTPGENDLSWDAGLYELKASLGDFVWNDLNGNGIQESGEPGMNGVTVKLYNQSGILLGTTTTASDAGVDGKYSFINLEPGYYYVVFTPPSGYLITLLDQGGNDALDSDGIVPNAQTILTLLSAGENDLTWDVGFTQPVGIGNRVWLDNGAGGGTIDDGIQSGSEPGVPGVTVELYGSVGGLLDTTFTNSSGNYYFDQLRPGDYYVKIPASQFATGRPLAGYASSTGAGTSQSNDQTVDENSIDDLALTTNGIRSQVYQLRPTLMPTGEDQSGYTGSLPDASVNATADFGFVRAIRMDKVLTTTEVDETGNDHTQATIGELVTYTLTTSFTQLDTINAQLVDTLDPGLAFANLVSITASNPDTDGAGPDTGLTSNTMTFDSSGVCTDCVAGTNPVTSNPYIQNNGGTATFNFGNVHNSDTANTTLSTITVVYQAVVLNTTDNLAGVSLNNSARLTWNGPFSPIDAIADDVVIVEPEVTISKTASVATADAGDNVMFTIAITNIGSVAAYDLTWSDSVPTGLTYVGPAAFSTCTAATKAVDASAAPLLSAYISNLEPGAACTLTFNTTVDYSVSPGDLITNNADIKWTSLDDTKRSGDVSTVRSSFNPASTERTGEGGVNTYVDSSSDDVTINNISTPEKYLVTTSEVSTSATNVVIGEIARYRLVVDLPEGTSTNFQVVDQLPAGMMFLNDGTVKAIFVSNGGGIASSNVGSLPVSGISDTDCQVTGSSADATSPAIPAACDALGDSNIGSTDSTAVNMDTYSSGFDVYFKLGTLVNNDNDPNTEYVVIEFNALVDNSSGGTSNDAGETLVNDFLVTLGLTPVLHATSASTVTLTVLEPALTLTKSAAISAGNDAGDTVTYTLTVNAASGADASTAFDVEVTDTLNANLTPVSVVLTSTTQTDDPCLGDGSGSTAFTTNQSFSGQAMTATATCLDPGNQLVFTITATVKDSAPAGQVIPNSAMLTYTSLPGANGTTGNATGSDVPGAPGTETGERNGNGTSPNDYTDMKSAPLTLDVPSFTKVRISPIPGADDIVQPGELVTYRIVVTVPEGYTNGLIIRDTLPAGFEYASTDAFTQGWTGGAMALASGPSVGDNLLTWTFNTPVSDPSDADPANDIITLDYSVRVSAIAASTTTPLNDGLDAINSVQVYYTSPSSGLSISLGTQTARIDVVRPAITATKSGAPASGDAGDSVLYTINIRNTGAATSMAYDVFFRDDLSLYTDYDTTYSMSCVKNPGAVVLNIEMDTLATDSTPGSFDTTPDAFATDIDQFHIAGDLDEGGANSWTLAQFAATGQEIVCTYQVKLLDTARAGSLVDPNRIQNLMNASLDTASGNQTGEQDFTDVNNIVYVTVPAPTFTKTRISPVPGVDDIVQPGETAQYRIVVTVPEGTTNGLIIRDVLPVGFQYESTDSLTAAWVGGALPAYVQAYNAGTRTISWTFSAGVINPGDQTPANNTITLNYTVRVTSTAVSTTTPLNNGSDAINTAEVLYIPAGGVSTSLGTQTARIDVLRPIMNATKTASVATGDSGDLVTYTVTIQNTGPAGSVAYDIYFNENLSDYSDFDTSYPLTCTGPSGGLTYEMDDLSDGFDTTPDLFITALDQFRIAGDLNEGDNPWSLASGQSLSCTYRVTLLSTVVPGATVTNLMNASFDTADNDQATFEEDKPDINNIATVTVPNPAINKLYVSSSETGTAESLPYHATIGEIVRYRLNALLIEGTHPNLQLLDVLPAGMIFVDDGTAKVAFVSDGSGITSNTITTALAGCSNLNISSTAADLVSVPSTLVTCPLPDTAVSINRTLDDDAYGLGTDVWFNLGNVVNQDSDDAPDNEYIVIEFNALMSNTSTAPDDNQAYNNATGAASAVTRANRSDLYLNSNPGSTASSSDVVVSVAEPVITNVNKTADISSGDAGDVVNYTVTFTNTAATTTDLSPAYNVQVLDILPAYLGNVTSIAVTPGCSIGDDTSNSSGNTVDVRIAVVPVSCAVEVKYSATIQDSAPIGVSIDNTANMTYTSLPGISGTLRTDTLNNPTGSDTTSFGASGASGAIYGERTGAGTTTNDYLDSDGHSVTIPTLPVIVKNAPTPTLYPIGSNVDYPIVVTLPEGTTRNVQIIDQVPLGMQYVSYALDTSTFDGTVGVSSVTPASPVEGDDMTFNFGNIITNGSSSNGTLNSFTVTVRLRVLDVPGNSIGTVRANSALLRYTPGTGAGTSDRPGGSQNITITEPIITTSKDVSPTSSVQAGDVLTYTVDFENTGTGTAYEVSALDTLAQGVNFTALTSCLLDAPATDLTAGTTVDTSVPGQVTFSGATWDIPENSTVTCIYTATAQNTLYMDGSHVNLIDADWSSQNGAFVGERIYDDSVSRTGVDETPGLDDDDATFTTDGPTFVKDDSGVTQVAIGNIITFHLTVGGEAGTYRDVLITDVLPAGLFYNAGSSQVTLNGSTTLRAPDSISAPNDGSAPVTLTWDYNDLYKDASNMVITYTATVANVIGNQIGGTLPNDAAFDYDRADGTPATRLPSSATSTITEPVIAFSKAIISMPAPLDAGGVVHYQITYTNGAGANVGTAWDVHITDSLASALLLPTIGAPDLVIATSGTVGSITNNSTTTDLDIWVASVAPGASVTVDFYPVIQNSISPGDLINNIGNTTWTSMVNHPDDERDGTGGVNNYNATSSDDFTVPSPYNISKQITTTSAVHTSGTDVAIGEEVTYNILLTFPEGTTPSNTVFDDLVTGLAIVPGSPELITSAAASGGLLVKDFNGTIGALNITTDTSDGGSIQFDHTNVVVNGDNDTDTNTVLLRFRAQVTNILANQAGVSLSNEARNTAGTTVNTTIPVTVRIVEPIITFSKAIISTPVPLDAGGVVHYQISYANATGATVSTAVDVHITDSLAAVLQLPSTGAPEVVITPSAGVGAITNNSTTSAIDITVASIPPGESVMIDFYPVIQSSVTPGQVINNIGNSTWTSLSGVVAGERDGTGGLNDYNATSSVNFTIPSPYSITKQITTTTHGGSLTEVAVGDEITYNILLTFPEGTTPSDTVFDDLVTGLAVVPGSPELITSAAASGGLLTNDFNGTIGSLNITTDTSDGGSVQYDYTNVIANGDNITTNNSLLLRFRARVTDNSVNVDGHVLTNAATNTAGSNVITSNTVDIDVVEPVIVTVKDITQVNGIGVTPPVTAIEANDVLTYVTRFTNTGTSTAYEVTAQDVLPANVDYNSDASCIYFDGSSPSMVAVTVTGTITLNFGTWDIPASNPDSYVQCTYTITTQADIALGASHTNTVDADWTSVNGTVANERIYDDSVVRPGVDETPGADDDDAVFSTDVPASLTKVITDGFGSGVTQVAIGDVFHVTIRIVSPMGALTSTSVEDLLPAGMVYVTGSQTVNANINVPTFSITGPNDGTAATTLTWDFGSAVVTGIPVVIEYNARAANVAGNVNGTNLVNGVSFDYTDGTGPHTLTANDNVTVIEPLLTVTKSHSVMAIAPDAGDTVHYIVDIAPDLTAPGVSTATAYDVIFTDLLASTYVTLDVSSIDVTATGWTPTSVNTGNSTVTTLDVRISDIPNAPGTNLRIEYDVTLKNTVIPLQAISNTGDITWTSTSGSNSNERTGTGSGPNIYHTTDGDTITVHDPYFSKTLVTTNLNSDVNPALVIGEIVTFGLHVTLPEGTTPAVHLFDDLPNGLEYVVGSANVVLPPGFIGNVPTPTVTPTIPPAGSGNDVTIDFGAITVDPDLSTANNTFMVQFQAVVMNEIGNQQPNILTNNSTMTVYDGTLPVPNVIWDSTTDATIDDTETVNLIEPVLNITKTANDMYPGPEQVVTFTLTVDHDAINSHADAYDVNIFDVLPATLTLDLTSFNTTLLGGATGLSNTSSGNRVEFTVSEIPLGGSVVIEFKATVAASVVLNQSIVNTANVGWTSMPGNLATNPQERTAPGTASDDYADLSTITLNIQKSLSKSLTGHSLGATPQPSVAIGEILTYDVVFNIPVGITTGVSLTDTLDPGLAFVECVSVMPTASISTTIGTFASICSSPVVSPVYDPVNPITGGRQVVFNFGDLNNTSGAVGSITVQYRVVVLDVVENQDGDPLNNSVRLDWSVGPLTRVSPTPLNIVEPDLTIEKVADVDTALPGAEITFTLTISHTGVSTADAYDVILEDILPAGLEYVPGSLVYVSGIVPNSAIPPAPPLAIDDTGAPTLVVRWDVFERSPIGESVIEFRARLGSVAPGTTISNTARVEWSSLPANPGIQSIYNERSVERRYDPLSLVDIYGVSSAYLIRVPALPATGFAPNVETILPAQPESSAYAALGSLWMEIPSLGVQMPIVGVPVNSSGWDLTWLGTNAGYLEGTAYPTWAGNTGITGHVTLPNGKPGPFANLYTLNWGQQVIVHMDGQKYIYEVRSIRRVWPEDISVLSHAEYPTLTLITCQGYNQVENSYNYRVAVQAVLVRVVPDDQPVSVPVNPNLK